MSRDNRWPPGPDPDDQQRGALDAATSLVVDLLDAGKVVLSVVVAAAGAVVSRGAGAGTAILSRQLELAAEVLSARFEDRKPSRRELLGILGWAGAGATLARADDVAGAIGALGPRSTVAPGSAVARGGPEHGAALALVPDEEATHRAVRSGRWNDASVWKGGVPDDGARAVIDEGVRVTLRHRDTARLTWLRVDGSLVFDPGTDTHLGVETVVTTPGSVLQIGTERRPVGNGSEASVEFVDMGPIDEDRDPERMGKGLLALGAVAFHGAEKTPWAPLAAHPTRGDEALELPEAPINWGAGDRVVVPGMDPDENEDEEAVVERVVGSTVHLDRDLDHDHVPPADDLDSYVLNLDRPIQFRSESGAIPRRGHLMFMSQATTLEYVGVYGLGRTDKSYPFTNPAHGTPPEDVPPNPRARYAVHYHRTGIDAEEPHSAEGCVVWDSPGWGFVNHHSFAHVTDCVSYRVFGAGFVAEAGDEQGSFARNFALRSAGSGEFLDSREFHTGEDDPGEVDDFGHGGHGFWLQGPTVAVEDNVAAGHRYYAYVFWNRPLIDRELRPGEKIDRLRGTVANLPVRYVTGQAELLDSDHVNAGKVSSAYVSLTSMAGNTAFASAGGLDVSRHQFGWDHTRVGEWSTVEDFTAFNIGAFVSRRGEPADPDRGNARGGNAGICVRYSHNLRFVGARLVSGTGRDGIGVNRNNPYPFHVSIEDADVEGFDRGIRATVRGYTRIEDARLANAKNVLVEDEHRHPTRGVTLRDVTFEGGRRGHLSLELQELEHTDPRELFNHESAVRLDGREAYFEEQHPDYVPVPDRAALEALGHRDWFEEATGRSAGAVVGLTNRELWERFGFAVKGEPRPAGAVRDERVTGWLEAEADAAAGEAWFEAEAGDLEEPWVVERSESASGGKYITTHGVDGTGEPPRRGHATYRFEVGPGEYAVRGRVRAPSGHDDSFWARVDGGPWYRWDHMRTRRGWDWESVPADDRDGAARFALSGGEHTLTVAFREDGTKLDKIVVTDNRSRPILLGEPAEEF